MTRINRDSRFDRRGDMTSITNWSERTDSTDTSTTTTGLGASPSRVTTGDELIAEKSDLFREAIRARNVYAAWARKLTNARPNDPPGIYILPKNQPISLGFFYSHRVRGVEPAQRAG
ncbi:hypothetical protein TNCV_110901 [Trichonephila clavipes]|nr:hypothetical protein TNCV_110901 [Trichonephila clavipes]